MVSALKVDGRRLHELARAGRSRSSASPPGDGASLRRRRPPTTRSCGEPRSTARRAPTCASLAADLGHALGRRRPPGRRCAAPRSGAFTLDERPPARADRAARRSIEAVRGLDRVAVDDDDGRRGRVRARCSTPARLGRSDGRRAVGRSSTPTGDAAGRLRAPPRRARVKPAVGAGRPVSLGSLAAMRDRRRHHDARSTAVAAPR